MRRSNLRHGEARELDPAVFPMHPSTDWAEFLLELDELRQATRAETQSIPATSSFSALQANKRYELECLDRLIDGVRGREDPRGEGGAP